MFVRKRISEEKVKLASAYYRVKDLDEYKKMMKKVKSLFNERLQA